MDILVATSNKGKLKEIKAILGDLNGVRILSLNDVNCGDIKVEETGKTFQDNALIKAKAYGDRFNFTTLADDSGLEVDFLGGAPGINSARYAGVGADDKMLFTKLLKNMEKAGAHERKARFKCVACLYDPRTKKSIFTEGVCEGEIAFEPHGNNGFGYDPVFVADGFNGKTMAELPPETKNQISHRARAITALKGKIKGL